MSFLFRHYLLLIALVVAIVIAVIVFSSNGESGDGSVDDHGYNEEVLLARGEYLVVAGNCASCHTTGEGELMAGGVAFETPFGTIYSTNITPDLDTGIGSWTEWDFLNSMRQGIRPNGEHLYPAFPYPAFTKVANEDLVAMFAYLKSIKELKHVNTNNDLSFTFNKSA